MSEEFPYLMILENPKHYHIRLCSLSGQDYVPYLKNEIFDWLDNNMGRDVDYSFKNDVCPVSGASDKESVGIAFADEENAMAFKLVWL